MPWRLVRSTHHNLGESVRKSQTNFGLILRLLLDLESPSRHESVAKSILFLASENWSGSITCQVLNVDSGKQGKVMWMKEEC
jgi:hypothetical protein